MEFPDLAQAREKITSLFSDEKEIAADDVCVIAVILCAGFAFELNTSRLDIGSLNS